MKRPLKAALLSAFVCPGAGHFFLNKRVMGGVLTAISLVCFIILLSISLSIATELAEQINTGELAFDIPKLSLLIHERIADSLMEMKVLLFIMIGSWLVAIVDSYRIGLQQEKME